MADYDPEQFWSRFRTLAEKDLPVILQTDIKQSTPPRDTSEPVRTLLR
jgi:hypothetical protein